MLLKKLLIIAAYGLLETFGAEDVFEVSAEALIYQEAIASKISSGTNANRTLKTDYALLSVVFINQAQICGGTLVSSQWILTSATCLYE